MNLDEGQRKQVAGWIEQGLKLSEIQKKLSAELNVTMTYMELRFLMDDLALKPKDPEPPAPKVVAPAEKAVTTGVPPPKAAGPLPPGEEEEEPPLDEEPFVPSGKVKVTVDQVTRPGTLASGQVTFSDLQTAGWYLDNAGRLGLVAPQKGYQPPREDIMEFQMELQSLLSKLG